MRYAVINNGNVVNVIEAPEGFVLDGYALVPSDIAGPSWTYDGEFHPPAPEPVPVPLSITPLQARRALRAAGLLGAVNGAVASADPDIQDAWEYAIEVRRDNPIIAGMAASLGLTEAQLDDLFRQAATL